MLRVVLFCILVAIAVAVAYWFAEHPGSVTIQWQGWVLDTQVGILALLVAVVAVLFTLFYNTLRFLWQAPGRWRRSWRLRRRERGYRALTLGMVAVAAGAPDEARRQARRADVLLGEPPLTMLLAAQTAQLDGDYTAARRYFEQMLERPETAFLGLRGLLMQAERDGDAARAVELAERANRLRPGTPWVLEALFDLQVKGSRWADAERTLESLEKHRLLTRDEARHRRAVLRIERSRAADARGESDRALQLAREAHKLDPDLVPASVELDRLQTEAGNPRRAEKVILQAWTKKPHPALARAFAELYADLPALERYRRFERLAKANPEHPETHFALAEAAIEAQLWGEARQHLKLAGGAEPPARVCRLMAEVETGENGDVEAARRWLARAADAAPDPTWVCGECGSHAAGWSATCPTCGAFDSLAWRTPDRVMPVGLRSPLLLEEDAVEAPPAPQPAQPLAETAAGDRRDGTPVPTS